MTVWKSACGRMELRLGNYREVLADVEQVDAVITDPPYSERTHAGLRSGSSTYNKKNKQETISYASWPPAAHVALGAWIVLLDPCWAVVFGDHRSQADVSRGLTGRYVFAPVGWVKPDGPRLTGDGPCVSMEWIVVSRVSDRSRWSITGGSKPGRYLVQNNNAPDKRGSRFVGQKPMAGMRALVRDYSRPGDLVCDPCAGSGTTLLAAAIEGRRAIGSEVDPDTFRRAVERLSQGYTSDLWSPQETKAEQGDLF
jgi:site-specific DNA-methyltransferase (adenine-specific)